MDVVILVVAGNKKGGSLGRILCGDFVQERWIALDARVRGSVASSWR